MSKKILISQQIIVKGKKTSVRKGSYNKHRLLNFVSLKGYLMHPGSSQVRTHYFTKTTPSLSENLCTIKTWARHLDIKKKCFFLSN